MADPSVVAFAMSSSSAQRGERRFELYRPKEEKTRRHARSKSAKRTKFPIFTRMERNRASETVGVSLTTSTVASAKENTINARSKSLAALRRMRRRKVVIEIDPLPDDGAHLQGGENGN